MVDNTNTGDETLENSSNTQSENPSDENISSSETDTIISTQEAKNMEVHHHSHAREKKRWKSYFWEFLMLFLAVFCGFLAEYQLEHVIEHQREKQYIKSLVSDLVLDIAKLNEGFPLKDERIKAIQSVFYFFETHREPKLIPGYVFRNINRTGWDRSYQRNTITINQLKNAGGMRMIRKKNVADSIAAYDLQWERLEFYREAYTINQQLVYGYIEKIMNDYNLLFYYRNNPNPSISPTNFPDSTMIRINPAHLLEYLNFLARQKRFTAQDITGYKGLKESAERLMELIKKEYNIK